MADIRVDSSWLDHRKRWRLYDALGNDGVVAIQDLWLYASKHAPLDGVLRGLTASDIVRAARYTGTKDLVGTLTSPEISLLDAPKGEKKDYRLHNWKIRQPYLSGAKERSKIAALGGIARNYKDKSAAASTKKVCRKQKETLLEAGCFSAPILTYPYHSLPNLLCQVYELLMEKVRTHRTNHKVGHKESDLNDIRLMFSQDKRDPRRTLELLQWYPIGQKYIPEIFCAGSLRKKWDQLDQAYKRVCNGKESPPGPSPEELEVNRKIAEQEMAAIGNPYEIS